MEADETLLEVTEETSEAAELPSDTVERPSLSGRRTAGGREMDRFRVKAELVPVFLVLSSDLFLGGLPRIVRAMAVSCWRCCSYCDSGSKGRRVGGAACLVGFCDFLIFQVRLLAVILLYCC